MELTKSGFQTVPISIIVKTDDDPIVTAQWQTDGWLNIMDRFGDRPFVTLDQNGNLIAGHALFEAYRQKGATEVPASIYSNLTPDDTKAIRIAYEEIESGNTYDKEKFNLTFQSLVKVDYDVSITTVNELRIEAALSIDKDEARRPESNPLASLLNETHPISIVGDLFQCGNHKVFCGDSRDKESYEILMRYERADAVLTDPPYGCRIKGFASRNQDDFNDGCLGYGEEQAEFFRSTLANLPKFSKPHSLSLIFIDWRSMRILLNVTEEVFSGLVNIATWGKISPAMGNPWRSQTEFCLALKNGPEQHRDLIQLGRHGRNRSNLWIHAGCNSFGKDRERLKDHPTPKPVGLQAEILRDISLRGEIILDPFGGSGSTAAAAERTGRQSRLIELEPGYVDVIVRRLQAETGEEAIHIETGLTFSKLAEKRASEAEPTPDASVSEQAEVEVAS